MGGHQVAIDNHHLLLNKIAQGGFGLLQRPDVLTSVRQLNGPRERLKQFGLAGGIEPGCVDAESCMGLDVASSMSGMPSTKSEHACRRSRRR
jgi:hypothetical protein